MDGLKSLGLQFGLVVFGLVVLMWLIGTLLLGSVSPASRVREGWLTLVVGLRGGGKSLFVARLIAVRIDKGVRVVTNFSCEGAVKMRSWRDVILAPRRTMVVLDEAHVWAGARSGVTLRPAAGWYISMCRHLGHEVWLISQHESQIASAVRDQVNEMVLCSRLGFGWHTARSFAPHEFRKKDARPLWRWRYRPTGRAVEIYDTHDLIPPVRDRKVTYDTDYDLIDECIVEIQARDHRSRALDQALASAVL